MRYAVAVTVGLCVVLVPIAWWLYKEGNYNEFVDCYLHFNLHGYGEQTGYGQWSGVRDITLVCLPGFAFYGLFLYFRHKERRMVFWLSLVFFFSVVLNVYVKNGYPHYTFPCFGVFALLLAVSWEQIRRKKGIRIFVAGICLSIGVVLFGIRSYFRLAPFDNSLDIKVASQLNKAGGASEYVMVYGFDDRSMWAINAPEYSFNYRLWLLVNGKPASRYFYAPPGMDKAMYEDSWCQIAEHAPLWVVAQEQNSADILRLGYEIYEREPGGYQILKRK